jgi:hypothetical protein
MLWLVLMLAVAGVFIYRADKKIRERFEDKFNPHEWDLPRSVDLTADINAKISGALSDASPAVMSPVSVRLDYEKKLSVFKTSHIQIFKALHAAVANDYVLLANVNVADVLNIGAIQNVLAMKTAQKNIAEKYFDFLVCDKNSVSALCAIVVGDGLEPLLVTACESASLPLARFKIQSAYDPVVIRASILNALGVSEITAVHASGAVFDNQESGLEIREVPELPPQKVAMAADGINIELCPQCSAVMIKRKAKNGTAAGQLFWICSDYPKCRGMLPVK